MKFHVVNLPHTQTTKDYCWCAYTSKVLRFCNMMTSLGHQVFLYGGTENEANVTEFITVVTDEDRNRWFGDYDWNVRVFDRWDSNEECWIEMNRRAGIAIRDRMQTGDILCLISGACQRQITDLVPEMRAVEFGIGYEGIIPGAFHVFESQAWMHYVYGMHRIGDGRHFDTVIPNSFSLEDYSFRPVKDDYLLYLGRLTPRKGMVVVEELAKLGHKIIVAGQGDIRIHGTEYVGVIRGKEKADLLAGAKALLVPTQYIEPFGGVAIEAMMSGTPVLTTDFGAFTETVIHGLNGYRCHTLGEFNKAIEWCADLDPDDIYVSATRYDTDKVRYEYEDYFERLSLLDNKGWYSL